MFFFISPEDFDMTNYFFLPPSLSSTVLSWPSAARAWPPGGGVWCGRLWGRVAPAFRADSVRARGCAVLGSAAGRLVVWMWAAGSTPETLAAVFWPALPDS